MDDRKKNSKKGSPVKGGAAANLQVASVVKSHKDDTAVVETTPEAEKVEGEVKADEAKTDVVPMAPIHVVGGEIDPELEREQLRASRKEDLKLLLADNPQVVLASDLSDEDKILVAEILSEQNQVVRDRSAVAEQLGNEKDELERKLSAANSKLGSVTNLISKVAEHFGKQNGVKNAVTKIGDDVSKDIAGLKGQVNANAKSVNDKVDGMAAMLGQIDKKISEIKSPPPPQQPPAQSSTTPSSGSSGWPWVVAVGILLAAVIAVFLLNKDVKIEVQVQQPAVNTVKDVVPPVVDNALGVTSQQVTPGGPGNPIVPTVVGATSDDPCKGKVGGELGSCVLQLEKFRPKGFTDAHWNTVVETFQNVIMVPLSVPFKDIKHHDKAIEHNMRKDAALQACVDAYVLKTDDVESNVRCQRAVDCLFTPVDEAAQCYMTHTRSITGVLVTVN